MPWESTYLLGLMAVALVLFFTEWVRTDVTAFLILLALLVPCHPTEDGFEPILSVERGLSGFGSPAVIMVASMFVLSAAMVHTGGAQLITRRVLRFGSSSELRFQVVLLVAVTLFSAFVNDTTTVILWMPMVLVVCRERGYAPSRFLMVLAYASLLGGQWTLIGTRSNILISDYLRVRTGEGLGFFAFTPIAACVLGVTLIFFLVIGRRLLPTRARDASLAERYEVTEYLTELLATPGSALTGKPIADLDLEGRFDVKLLQLIRGDRHLQPAPHLRLQAGDSLVVQGRITNITELLERSGLQVQEELQVGDKTLRSVDLRMGEVVVAPGSPLEGQPLEGITSRYPGVSVLAIARHGRPRRGRLSAHRFQVGDSLLLVGHQDEFDRLRGERGLFLLESKPFPPVGRSKAYLSIGLMAFVAIASATRLLHPGVAIPLAALLAVLCRCLGTRQVYESINLQALVVIGSLIPFGYALEDTGTAELIGSWIHANLGTLGVHAVFATLLLLAVLMTQVIENAAVAVILAPIAYELSVASGVRPEPFMLGLAICVSTAFMSPVAHESTILVMAPGRYRFVDYLRLGTPLALIAWLVTVAAVSLIQPLTAR